MIRFVNIVVAFLFIAGLSESADDLLTFDIRQLEGKWQGTADVEIIGTGTKLELEGTSTFAFDSSGTRLLTTVEAGKYMLTYKAQGWLYEDEKSDSVVWEMNSSRGRRVQYKGAVRDGTLQGRFLGRYGTFRAELEFRHIDTVEIRIDRTEGNGTVTRVTDGIWWRVPSDTGP
ncbi:MAG: hypothetical protein ACE5FH_04965 [Candidatus Zixiibacteriota bacterium]